MSRISRATLLPLHLLIPLPVVFCQFIEEACLDIKDML